MTNYKVTLLTDKKNERSSVINIPASNASEARQKALSMYPKGKVIAVVAG
jgi:hypothetical protein